jgi:hypothetical protein
MENLVIDRAERLSHFVQRRTGFTCFTISRVLLVFAIAGAIMSFRLLLPIIEATLPLEPDSLDVGAAFVMTMGPLVIVVSLGGLFVARIVEKRAVRASARREANEFRTDPAARIAREGAYAYVLILLATFFAMIPAHGLILATVPPAAITYASYIVFACAVLFLACTPLPPSVELKRAGQKGNLRLAPVRI